MNEKYFFFWASSLLMLVLFFLSRVQGQVNSLFGRPNIRICRALWKEIMHSQNLGTRWFDEEELLVEEDLTWPGINNTLEPPVIQLPKYFSAGKPLEAFT